METTYRKIEFTIGSTIEEAMVILAQYNVRNILVYGEFNGHKLYSDTDDINSAYLKITGKTKAEFDEAARIAQEKREKQEKSHEEAIPDLTKEWIEKGNGILSEKYHELWAKCVPIRLRDLYQGMELGATLDIVKELNAGCDLELAKTIIDKQGHSGMSFSLVCAMIKSFCDRGEEFVEYVK